MKKASLIITIIIFIVFLLVLLYLFIFMKDTKVKIEEQYLYGSDELILASINTYKKDYDIKVKIDNDGSYEIEAILKDKIIAIESMKLLSKNIHEIKKEIKNIDYRNLKYLKTNNYKEDIYSVSVYFNDKTITMENITMSNDIFNNLLLMIYDENSDLIKSFNKKIDKYYDSINKKKLDKKKSSNESIKSNESTNSNNSSYNGDSSHESKNSSNPTNKVTTSKKDTETNTKGNNTTNSDSNTIINKNESSSTCKGKPIFSWMSVDYKTFVECMSVANSYNDGTPRFCSEVVDCTGKVLGFMLDY